MPLAHAAGAPLEHGGDRRCLQDKVDAYPHGWQSSELVKQPLTTPAAKQFSLPWDRIFVIRLRPYERYQNIRP